MSKQNKKELKDVMNDMYLQYALHVVAERALPDVRDGLKPVHRRILYGAHKLNLKHNEPHKKSARLVGDIIGKYHPHGDSVVYDAAVRMAQDFSMRYPTMDGQGNFGSIDGDSAAAMRYCLTGDALITTEDGIKRIKDLDINKHTTKINTKVLGIDGSVNEADVLFNSGKHEVQAIELENGLKTKGSLNHPILILNEKFEYEWKMLENIKTSDLVLLPKYTSKLWGKRDNLDEAALLAIMLTKVFVSLDNINILGITKENTKILNKYMIKETGEGFTYRPSYIKGRLDIDFNNAELIRKFNNEYGEVYTANKNIPQIVFDGNEEYLKTFLSYYFDSVGVVRRGMLYIDNYRANQLKDIQIILQQQFGIHSTFHKLKDNSSSHLLDKSKSIYRLQIEKDSLIKFESDIGLVTGKYKRALKRTTSPIKKNDTINNNRFVIYRLGEIINKDKNYEDDDYIEINNVDDLMKNKTKIQKAKRDRIRHILDNYYIVRVRKANIYKNKKYETVYSPRVLDDSHAYIANGMINHNTEIRMSPITEQMLRDINKDTVDFVPNFDGEETEPVVLPAYIPHLLVNGSMGIAVGFATEMPPHNLKDTIKAVNAYIDNQEIEIDELTKLIKAPDFPTGGTIYGYDGVKSLYKTGSGRIVMRAKAEIEKVKRKEYIIITQLPYGVNKSKLVNDIINKQVKTKKIDGIADVRDESDRNGMRIVVELRGKANPQIVLNNLYKRTALETNFNASNVCLVDGKPRVLNLKEMIHYYVEHLKDVEKRKIAFDLSASEKRLNIVKGLIIAVDNIKDVIDIIQNSKNEKEIKEIFNSKYDINEAQAEAILSMQLRRLSSIEKKSLTKERAELNKEIKEFKSLLKDSDKLNEHLKLILNNNSDKYGDERKTKIQKSTEDLSLEDLVEDEEAFIVIENNFIKRLNPSNYNRYKEYINDEPKDKDGNLKDIKCIESSSLDKVLFFSDRGNVYGLNVIDIEENTAREPGEMYVNLIGIEKGEKIIHIDTLKKKEFIIATDDGKIKKLSSKELENTRESGIIYIKLRDEANVVDVSGIKEDKDIILATKLGQSIRFNTDQTSPIGRNAMGVNSINLAKDDLVIGFDTITDDTTHILVGNTTTNSYKKTVLNDDYYPSQNRAGKGVLTVKLNRNNKEIDFIKAIGQDDLFIINNRKINVDKVQTAVRDAVLKKL